MHTVLFLMLLPLTFQEKEQPSVQFPLVVQPVPPIPAQVTKLTGNQIYVITSEVPCFVLASPNGLVNIAEDVGPIKIRGVFVDGNGKIETRTYRQKQVFLIEANGKGTVELLVVIVGKTKAAEVLRKTVEVDNGQGPIPPPDPPNPPNPPIPVAGLRVLMVEETSQRASLTKGQQLAMFGKVTRDYLDSHCVKDGQQPAYRILDKDVNMSSDTKAWQDAMARPRTALPWMYISNGANFWEGPMPANIEDITALLKKYGGN
jgi:hypothetical protein